MIAGQALANWLTDREAQLRTRDAINDYADSLADHPLIAGLDRAIAALPHKTAEAVLGVARDFLDRETEIDALINDLIARCRADPFFRPPFLDLSNDVVLGMILYARPELTITLGLTRIETLAARKSVEQGAPSVPLNGFHMLMRFVRAGEAVISLWEAPPLGEGFVEGEAGALRLVERRRVVDGEDILVDGRRQGFVIEHAAGDMLYFQVTTRVEAAPVSAEFDSATGELTAMSSTDEVSSRLEMMASLLRSLDCQAAIPVLEKSLSSPQFYTRWHVMREMLAIDAQAALPALKRMAAGDPHPEIREAARQTLEMFFPDEAQGDVACPA